MKISGHRRIHLVLFSVLLAGSLCAATNPELTKDAPGSKDPALTGRFAGSVILCQEHKQFDEYKLALGMAIGWGDALHFQRTQDLEGAVTRTLYVTPAGSSSLEVLRNFGDRLEGAGFRPLFACSGQQCVRDSDGAYLNTFGGLLYPSQTMVSKSYSQMRNYLVQAALEQVTDIRYEAWSLTQPQGDIAVAIFTAQQTGGTMGDATGALQGSVLALVDVVEQKPMENHMVTVSAEQLQQDLALNGKAVLYGIYFDSNKAEVKPSSRPQLEQIAKFLQSHPSVKVYVVGHTDDQGKFSYNLDLSNRRAHAVVQALTADYKIGGSRLTAAGVGPLVPVAPNTTEEGRAKNRRVEIVERLGQ